MASQDETAAAAAATALAATALGDAPAPAEAAAPDATAAADGPSSSSAEEQKVDPWNVSAGTDGKVDYDKLSRDFGVSLIDDELIKRFERVTGTPAHPFLRRGIVFAHRDLDLVLDAHERGEAIYLYTGRGPSSEALHLGHLVPFMFTLWLQRALGGCPVVIQLTDDEKTLCRSLELERAEELCAANVKDIIAVGFEPRNTFIFSDFEYMGGALYKNVIRIQRQITFNQVKGIFGFGDSTNIGMVSFPAVQAAPALPDTFPHIFGENQKGARCLVPCAIDQDPYFRMTRDVCWRLGHHKTATVEARFFPALQGEAGKMSASDPNSAVFVTDSPKQIRTKVNKHAFSGGRATVEEHRELGADLGVDIPWKWLQFFVDDDDELARIGDEYGSGRMLTGEVKAKLIERLCEVVGAFQERRAKVDDAIAREFTRVRDMTGLMEGKVFAAKGGGKKEGKKEGGGGGGGGDGKKKKKGGEERKRGEERKQGEEVAAANNE